MAGGKRDEQAHPSNGYDRPSSRHDRVPEEETDHINVEMQNIGEEQELQHPSPNGNARGQEEEPGHTNPGTMAGGKRDEQAHPSNGHDRPSSRHDRVQKEETDNMQNCRNSKFFVQYCSHIATAVGGFLVGGVLVGGVLVFFTGCTVYKSTLNPDDSKLLLAASEHGRRPCLPGWIWYEMKCFYFSDKEGNWSASQDFCSLYNASLAVIEEGEEKDFVQRYKGPSPHWIGLQRDPKQPWKWVNGSASTWEVLGDGGNCAFLNDEGKASSSWCLSLHHWICSKPDEFTRPKIV